jgi:phosphatidylglycerol lysyltransferase
MAKKFYSKNDLTPFQKYELLLPFLREFGNGCMAYSTLQPGLDYLIDNKRGYIAFLSYRHPVFSRTTQQIVLANPVSSADDYERMYYDFIRKYPSAMFVQFDARLAEVIHHNKRQVNQFGIETELYLNRFSLSGRSAAKLRQWKNKAIREEVTATECDIQQTDPNQIRLLVEDWIKRKGKRELKLLTRPFNHSSEPDVRYFMAEHEGRLVGLAGFDPIYSGGSVIGYYHNFDRIHTDAPRGTGVYTLLHAIKTFRNERKTLLSLGMSPLSELEDDFNFNPWFTFFARFTYNYCNFLYPFKGNASHKNRFPRSTKKVYFSAATGNGLKPFVTLGKAINLL